MLNKVMLIGHLGKDPELCTTHSGQTIARLSLATSEAWTDQATGTKEERTEWHRIVVMADGAVQIVKNMCKRGSRVYVEGRIATRKWDGKDGITRYTTEIVIGKFGGRLLVLSGFAGQPSVETSVADESLAGSIAGSIDDGVPF